MELDYSALAAHLSLNSLVLFSKIIGAFVGALTLIVIIIEACTCSRKEILADLLTKPSKYRKETALWRSPKVPPLKF
jgi:hypothetical protein